MRCICCCFTCHCSLAWAYECHVCIVIHLFTTGTCERLYLGGTSGRSVLKMTGEMTGVGAGPGLAAGTTSGTAEGIAALTDVAGQSLLSTYCTPYSQSGTVPVHGFSDCLFVLKCCRLSFILKLLHLIWPAFSKLLLK